MPDAVAPAAPAAPAPNAATQSTNTEAPKAEGNAWSPDDDKAFKALLTKRGLKVKANGQETAIDSVEALTRELDFAARGRGASKLTESAKKELEEARKLKAEFEHASRRRQQEAEGADERAQQEARLAELPPEVRELYLKNRELEQQIADAKAEREEAAKAEEARRIDTLKGEHRKAATGFVQKVVDAFGLDLKADAEEARPFLAATYQAMREFSESGLDLVADTTAEQIVRRVQQLRSEASEKAFGRLKPERRVTLARGALEQLAAEVFGEFDASGVQTKPGSGEVGRILEAVGPKTALAIAKAVAASQRAAKSQPRPAQSSQTQQAQKSEPPPRQVLRAAFGSPFLGGNR